MSPVLVALVLFIGNVVKGMAGFGGPLLAIPLLSLGMPTADAMMLSILTDLATSMWLGVDAWRRVPTRLALTILIPLLLGQVLGTELLAVLPVPTVRALLAIVVGAFALSLLLRPVRPHFVADLNPRVAVEHGLAHVCTRRGRRARYVGVEKSVFDLCRYSVVENLFVADRIERAEPA